MNLHLSLIPEIHSEKKNPIFTASQVKNYEGVKLPGEMRNN